MTSASAEPEWITQRPHSADTWYEVLDVKRDADHASITRAYHRAIALIEGRNLGGYFMLDPAAIKVARKDIETAFAILSDADKRRAYDRSLIGDDADGPVIIEKPKPDPAKTSGKLRFLAPIDEGTPPSSTAPETVIPTRVSDADVTLDDIPLPVVSQVAKRLGGIAFAAPKTDVGEPVQEETSRPVEVARTLTPQPSPVSLEGEINGMIIKRLREARGLSIEELADATKIRKPYLRAIEEQDFDNLPGRVYLRGFLTQIARVLRVDKVVLADGYLAFIARFGK